MSCRLRLAQLVEILAAEPVGLPDSKLESVITGITTDSRSLRSGEVFVALRGERFDGHAFVDAARQQNAIAAVVDRSFSLATPKVLNSASLSAQPFPVLRVEDTLVAYQAIARWWRDQFDSPVIAVTGSVGKTTTKELIAAVLSTHGRVLKSQANFNNEIGVPKTLLELNSDHDFAVIEMGMRAAGEIALLTRVARPTIAVITNVGTAHIGRLGSEQAIANAKCELLAELSPNGVAILNHDNSRLISTANQVWQGKILTYGLTGGDIQGQFFPPNTVGVDGISYPVPFPGEHNALNYLAALAVAKQLQISWEELVKGLEVNLPPGRARRYDLPNDVVMLDETYNAGLESMIAALRLLVSIPGTRHIAILGTMKELGERSPELHHQVGRIVKQLHLDHLLILADPAESQALAAGANPVPTEELSSHDAVVHRLAELVQPGDRLLFKASRAVGLDQVVDRMLAQWLVNGQISS
jgi:UDP-N-acetylmuramoyl-tripeptide--D-alanyl-D-alanine ligase